MVFPEGLFYEDVYWMPQLYMYAEGVYVMGEKLYHHDWNPDSVVFSRNTDHHRDALTIQSMKWESYIKHLRDKCGMDKLLKVYQAAYDRYAGVESAE